ncbi:MAG: hypothetical protein R3240_00700 [Gammaproteobacteria bacterium]|nr:hypothetical protein [Gammaproteobacteria bacterium]
MIDLTANIDNAVITKLDPKTIKEDKDERLLGYSVDFKAEVSCNFMEKLAIQGNFDYEKLLYMEDGALAPHMITKLVFDRVFDQHSLKIDLDLISEQFMVFHKVTLKSFKAVPVFGKNIKLSFRMQLDPTPTEVEFLNRAVLISCIKLEITPPTNADLDQSELDL